MAKKSSQSGNIRYAVNKKALKKARAQAALDRAQQEERAAKREKSRRMSSAFLFAVLALICVFCLYTLIRTLFFPAGSVAELRSDLLFVSVVAIPVLMGAAAVLLWAWVKKRRDDWSDRVRKLAGLFCLLLGFAACILFGAQFLRGRQNAAGAPAYTQTVAALERSGLAVAQPEQVERFRALLESDLLAELRCGETDVLLNCHADAGWVADRFAAQAARDYADYPRSETQNGAQTVTVWGPRETDGAVRAAVALRSGTEIRILELAGPAAEVEALLPLLTGTVSQPS